MEDDGSDTLFVACTRPMMKFGVPLQGYVANVCVTMLVTTIVLQSPPGFFLGFAFHFALRELCRIDPHFFRRWYLFFITKMRSRTGVSNSVLKPRYSRVRKWQHVRGGL
jgi:type IV secretory pathway VirB3-like protein